MDYEKLISEWLEELKYQSESFLQYVFSKRFDDSTGWGRLMKEKLNKPSAELRRGNGLLVSGPRGCGKHTAVYHALAYLADPMQYAYSQNEEPFTVLYLSGEDFSFPGYGSELVYESLNGLLDAYSGKPLCLVAEYPEACPECGELLKQLGRFSRMYAVEEDFSPLLLIIITEKEKLIPATLMERLDMCRLSLPSQRRRLVFLENMISLDEELNNAFNDEKRGMSIDELAELTEGADYSLLRDIVAQCSVFVHTGEYLVYDNIKAVVGEFIPERLRHISRQELYGRVADMIDMLPDILSRMPAGANAAEAAQNKTAPAEIGNDIPGEISENESDLRSSIDKMTTGEIALSLFGEERLNKLLEKAQSGLS